MDEAHLPWVHAGMLGNRHNVPPIPAREIIEEKNGFYYETRSEVSDRLKPGKVTTNVLTYRIVLPFTIYHENIYPDGNRVIDLFFSSPVSERECIRYTVVGRNFALDQSPDKLVEFTLKIWEQDRVIIESQRPEEIPTDLKSELHIRGADAPSI